jgi:hypothetical protein
MPGQPSSDRTHLEPVTCWPLIVSTAGFAALAVVSVAGMWAWNVLAPRAPVASRSVAPPPVTAAPAPPPVVEQQQPVAFRPERRVVVKTVVEDHWHWPKMQEPLVPRPAPARTLAAPALAVVTGESKPGRRSAVATPAPLVERASKPMLELRQSLWDGSRALDLDGEKGASAKLFEAATASMRERERLKEKGAPALTSTLRDLLAKRDDLRGLPLAAEDACQTAADAAKALGQLSRDVRLLARGSRGGVSLGEEYYARLDVHAQWLEKRRGAHAKDAKVVGPLAQMLQVESEPARVALVATLAAIGGKEASRALADRAVFDLSPHVRKSAIDALKARPADEVRPGLLAGLAYPWAEAADHAAFALLELNDLGAGPHLEKILKGPDPCAPFEESGKWYERELVRVNHLRSCVLCHAPSIDTKDVVTGPVPTPGRPLPELYYAGRAGGQVVRADVVYLRQDFSAMHPIADAKPWPESQRFDYLVRKRELTAKEVAILPDPETTASPQREAARLVLAELKKRQANPVARAK